MWTRNGNIWRFKTLPALSVEACVTGDGSRVWCACFSGRLVQQIRPGKSSADVKRRTFEYFDRRVNL